MDTRILAANLKRLRAARKMSQQALAEASGVSSSAIKKLEREGTTPRANTLMQITKALGANFQDLFVSVQTIHNVRFRARKKVPGREQILARIAKWLDDFNSLESQMGEIQRYKLNDLAWSPDSKSDPVVLAGEVRKALGLKEDEPIHDICGLLEHAGIKLLPYIHSSDKFFGLSVGPAEKGPAIIVNTWDRISTERQIFSAAHELGHLLMHLNEYNDSEEEEPKEQEKEADQFAGYFLMPKEGFDKEWDDTFGMHFLDRVMKVKRIFRVSYKVVLFRLVQEGQISSDIWRQFPPAFERYYGKKLSQKEEPYIEGAEPYGMQPFDFYEDRLGRLVRKAIDEEQISISRGAEILGLTTEAILERVAEWEAFV
jgi:Zn-dependent peptidase ImmA (M78 family)/DNA-binding XRE family transcriptional regulator